MTKILPILLGLSGLVAAGIGAALLFEPVAFEASAGIALPDDPNLTSELRAPGAALLGAGAFMLLGAFVRRFTRPALWLATGLYLAYGVGRLVGFAIDGLPGPTLAVVAAVELTIGLACLAATARAPRSPRDTLAA